MTSISPHPPSRRVAGWIDRWIDPDRMPEGLRGIRQARIVVVEGWLGLLAHAILAATLVLGEVPMLPLIEVALAVIVTVVALAVVRWGGQVEVAAWALALALALTPVFQASVDLGIRDPALALVMLAPFAGALTSGARLATVSAAVGAMGALVLFGLDVMGLAPEPFSTPDEAAGYAIVMVTVGSALSATAGVLYAKHTRHELVEAEGQSTRLDAALRASEERYRSLFDHIPVGMYRSAPDGRVLLANATLARLIGAPSPEAARAYNAIDFYVDRVDRDRFRDTVHRDGFIRGFETRWRRPGGDVRHVRIDARVALGPDGEPMFYEGAVEDVTAEREARIALHRSEARFKALVQRSSDVVVVADRGDRFTYVSPAVGPLLGHLPESLLNTALVDLVHPDDRTTAEAFLDEARGGVPSASVELRLCHTDGHDVFVEGAATALYDDPAVGGLVLNLRDVTERKRAQAVLVQAKRQAEEVAALKSTFLANMSHEIRTPLTAILGFADVLAEEVTDETQGEFVGLIARSGRRLMDTLNSVLDLARLEAGRGGLVEERVDLGDLAREAADMFGPAAGERGLEIRAEVEPGEHAVTADEAAVVRVLHNLVGNAIKFTDEGGVTLAVRTDRTASPRVQLVVRDTGIGVDDAFLPRIFGEFEQESTGAERKYEGAGLGLALSRQLVDRMGGVITVESEKGAGTEFTVSFPALSAGAEAADDRPLVLIVDDNEQAREIAVHTLADAFQVATAGDGEAAFAAIDAARPDVVLLDIHLGLSISGEDVMRQLRASPTFAGLPIVAVTAYGLPGDRERFLAAGFDAYLTKPYGRADLREAVARAIQARTQGVALPPPTPSHGTWDEDPPGGGVYISRAAPLSAPARPPSPVPDGAA